MMNYWIFLAKQYNGLYQCALNKFLISIWIFYRLCLIYLHNLLIEREIIKTTTRI